jgi:imidazolonepropionase-like amidohydrolase
MVPFAFNRSFGRTEKSVRGSIVVGLAIAGVVLLLHGCAEKSVQPPTTLRELPAVVIDGAQIWDGTGTPAVQDAVLVIKGDRIEAVGPRGTVTVPQDARTIDAKGKTLIPGLINMHGHVGMTKGLKQSKENYSKENILAQLKQYARYGVTTVMSLGTDFEAIFELRGPAKADESPRATVFTAGRGFTGKQGYPAVLPGNAGIPVEVDSVDEVKAHIQELARQKVDMVKIWVDDHWGHYKKIRPELYRAIIEEAHKQNLRVMAHLFYLVDAKGLVTAGLDGMAHSVRDREVDDALIKMLKEKRTFAVPTLTREESTFVYAEPPAFLDDPFFSRWADPEVITTLKDPAWGKKVKADPDFSKYPGQLKTGQKNLKKLFDAGVKIAFGTDTGPPARFQGYFEHRELELMVQAGLTPAQALRTATLNAAECLKIEQDYGSLEKGKRADLVLLDADPLEDILNTRRINQVWIGGREVN